MLSKIWKNCLANKEFKRIATNELLMQFELVSMFKQWTFKMFKKLLTESRCRVRCTSAVSAVSGGLRTDVVFELRRGTSDSQLLSYAAIERRQGCHDHPMRKKIRKKSIRWYKMYEKMDFFSISRW